MIVEETKKTTTLIDKRDVAKLDKFLEELKKTGYEITRQTALKIAIDDFVEKYKHEPIMLANK